jgi:hypothetical protein
MPHHLPVALPTFKATPGLVQAATLEPAPVIQVSGAAGGTVSIVGVAHCHMLAVPSECPVKPGIYTVEFRAAGRPTLKRTVEVTDKDVAVEM